MAKDAINIIACATAIHRETSIGIAPEVKTGVEEEDVVGAIRIQAIELSLVNAIDAQLLANVGNINERERRSFFLIQNAQRHGSLHVDDIHHGKLVVNDLKFYLHVSEYHAVNPLGVVLVWWSGVVCQDGDETFTLFFGNAFQKNFWKHYVQ